MTGWEHRRRRTSRSRSKSPRPEQRREKDRHPKSRDDKRSTVARERPYRARELSKHDYRDYKALFATYLDVQKQLFLEDLDEDEARGRWKSFVGHWNRAELAEGWYDPAIKERADREARNDRPAPEKKVQQEESDEESDEEIGPALPGKIPGGRAGPTIPNANDLALKDELREEDRMEEAEDTHWQRKHERKVQRERLDELAPKAQGGTKERQLEKKQESRESNRAYREAASGGGEIEFKDADLLGAEDGLDDLKRRKAEMQRKKNDRELRREEILRAKAQEREERLKEHAAREEKTMAMLRALAKQNFG